MRGRETGNFHVVTHHVLVVRERMRLALEKSFLVIPTRPPAQHTGDVQIFSDRLPPHMLGLNPLFRTLVVAAPRGMHMMIAAVPAAASQVNPTLQLQRHFHGLGSGRHLQLLRLRQILWASSEGNLIVAGWQIDMYGAVELESGDVRALLERALP